MYILTFLTMYHVYTCTYIPNFIYVCTFCHERMTYSTSCHVRTYIRTVLYVPSMYVYIRTYVYVYTYIASYRVFELSQVRDLNLSVNKLTAISSDVGRLTHLTTLDLRYGMRRSGYCICTFTTNVLDFYNYIRT